MGEEGDRLGRPLDVLNQPVWVSASTRSRVSAVFWGAGEWVGGGWCAGGEVTGFCDNV